MMKIHLYKYLLVALGGMFLTGCDRYLDITPKGSRLLSTVADYDQWLNDETLARGIGQPTGADIIYLTDDVDIPSLSTPPSEPLALVYTWASQFSVDLNAPPVLWAEHYAKINLYNTVLAGIDEATGGTPAERRGLKAEALLGRALEYFYLMNEYGKPYDPASAEQDPAVPFVTSNDVTQTVPPRSTVADLYAQLVADLTEAIPGLPDDNSSNRFRGSKASAYSILARLHFYAFDYQKARENAELALSWSGAEMLNYNGPFPATEVLATRPDVIYGRLLIGQAPTSLELMRSFESNDLRIRTLYTSTENYAFANRGTTTFFPLGRVPNLIYVNTGTSVQEMKLVIAESAARAGDLTTALRELDEIRQNRFPAATYTPFTSTDQEEVLEEVLKERRHELAFHGLRWFDMRRLAKEGRMGTVRRLNAAGETIATLEPNSDRYTLQIPAQVLSFNPGMQQNP